MGVAPLALEVVLARVVGWEAEEVQDDVHAEVHADVQADPGSAAAAVVVGCTAVVGSTGAGAEEVGSSTKTPVELCSTGAGAGSAGSTLATGSWTGTYVEEEVVGAGAAGAVIVVVTVTMVQSVV